jgi:hypothetical protein
MTDELKACKDSELTCNDCGMTVETGEYHPFAACLMYKGCYNKDTVIANLNAITLTHIPISKAVWVVNSLPSSIINGVAPSDAVSRNELIKALESLSK